MVVFTIDIRLDYLQIIINIFITRLQRELEREQQRGHLQQHQQNQMREHQLQQHLREQQLHQQQLQQHQRDLLHQKQQQQQQQQQQIRENHLQQLHHHQQQNHQPPEHHRIGRLQQLPVGYPAPRDMQQFSQAPTAPSRSHPDNRQALAFNSSLNICSVVPISLNYAHLFLKPNFNGPMYSFLDFIYSVKKI